MVKCRMCNYAMNVNDYTNLVVVTKLTRKNN